MKKKSNNKIVILAVLLVMILSVTVPVQAQELAKRGKSRPTPVPESSDSEDTAADLVGYAQSLSDRTSKFKKDSEKNLNYLQSQYEAADSGELDTETVENAVSEYKKIFSENVNLYNKCVDAYNILNKASDYVEFTSSEKRKFQKSMKAVDADLDDISKYLRQESEIINNMKDTLE